MKRTVALVICMALLVPAQSYAYPFWFHHCFKVCHLPAKNPGGFFLGRCVAAIPSTIFGLIVLNSQAWRNCKDQYPTDDTARGKCQANMTWAMPTFSNLSPVVSQ